jgi:hypothetical protein
VLGNKIKDKCIKITAAKLSVLKRSEGHFSGELGISKPNGIPIVRGDLSKRIGLVPKTPGAVVAVFDFGVEQQNTVRFKIIALKQLINRHQTGQSGAGKNIVVLLHVFKGIDFRFCSLNLDVI